MPLEQLGPYRLGKQLGKGGMGTVYEARELESGEAAAIKVLSPSLAAEEGFRVRFEAEIESLKKLRHPNIVRLYGYGEQAGTLYYAMELIEGSSLEEEVRAGRRFDWREVTGIAIKLCRALKHAHDHGVIHRDLKPANVMLTGEGEVRLSDFGIARLFGNARLTADGGVLGTAEYMAPEQASGAVVTERCDQYSLGGLLYALLAGRPPFRAKTLVEMLQLQRYAEPEPVTRYAPQTPAEMARIIHQLLEKEPQRRFANTLILARSLEAMERGLSISMSRGDDFVISSPGEPAPAAAATYDPKSPTLSPADLAALERGGASPSAGIEETAATIAFDEMAARQRAAAAEESAASQTADRFTKVEDRAHSPLDHEEHHAGLFSPQTVLLIASLAMLLGAGWYFMRPPSADRLFNEIEQLSAEGDVEQLQAALPKTQAFLANYADDPRADQVRAVAEEAQQDHPVQRAYTEAKRLMLLNPDLAAARFQALIDVYDEGDGGPETVRHFVKNARVKLKTLKKQLADRVAVDREQLTARLARADDLAADNPAAARKIYEGVITLYAEKPWAAEIVERARRGLASAAPPQPADQAVSSDEIGASK
ncbi:MAG: serine/threonine protein kinase [Pirellulales bacterium]